jgi:5'-3' exonuclease
MAWIVQYYTGAATAMDWSYSWLLPPLWANLLEEFPETVTAPTAIETVPLQPIEQLALVLPAASWQLIDKHSRQSQFIKAAPEFFPAHFELESIGRRYTWEAEAKIPIPTINQLRAILEHYVCNT